MIFPIALIEGENGENGIKLYNFLEENSTNVNGDYLYEFKNDEEVSFSAFGLTHIITDFIKREAIGVDSHVWTTSMETFGGSTLVLTSSGKVYVNYV